MQSSILAAFLLLFVVTSAFYLDAKSPRRIIGKKHQRTAAELKAYHQQRRAKAEAEGKNYIPNYPNDLLFTEITIGNTGLQYYVALETGSDSLWVIDSSYPNVKPDVATFNPNNRNSTAVAAGDFHKTSENYNVDGKAYTDTITYLAPIKQTFGSVTAFKYSWDNPEFDSLSGAFGLAWDPNKKSEKLTENSAPILNLLSIYSDSPRMFSLVTWHNETDGTFLTAAFIIGDNLNAYCNRKPVIVAPLSYNDNTNQLSFSLDSFAFDNQKIDGDLAKVDSGSSLIYVPAKAFDILYSSIQPDFNYDLGFYTVPCSKRGELEDLVFTIGGAELRVPSTNYVIDLKVGGGQCVLAILLSNTYNTPYALGLTFMYNNFGVEWSIDDTTITFKTCFAKP
ncbi:hypothetical protein M3Y94_00043200 [Aphelenchoides besseyi]|nr:hypothetical protein M3Y94_00043200 [Aphelenchoides besseyi]KAI6219114.1 Peptidase A1 domain-containing protein [Aphelenchoides besseyi]